MPTVLIVDDEQHIRLLIEQTLEELEDEGVELLTAPDGEVALDVVRNHKPGLVFLDVMMPKRNGFEVCRAIKGDPGLAGTYVVLLTAKGQAYDRQEGEAAGADRLHDEAVRPGRAARTCPQGARARRRLGRRVPLMDVDLAAARRPPPPRRADALVPARRDERRGPDQRRGRDGDPRARRARGSGRTGSPIVVEGETVGWVEGDRAARAVASVLAYAAAREADKRSLAREALERYRELNLVYDLADALSGLRDVTAVAEAALAEVNRLPGGGVGFLLLGNAAGGGGLTTPDGVLPGPVDAVRPGKGLVGAIALGEAEIVNDAAGDPRRTDADGGVRLPDRRTAAGPR